MSANVQLLEKALEIVKDPDIRGSTSLVYDELCKVDIPGALMASRVQLLLLICDAVSDAADDSWVALQDVLKIMLNETKEEEAQRKLAQELTEDMCALS
jgi:hypothetical protein